MRDPRLNALLAFFGVTIAVFVALLVVIGGGKKPNDLRFTTGVGLKAYSGVTTTSHDDGPEEVDGQGLADRYAGIENPRDEPIQVVIDPASAKRAADRGVTARVGFLVNAKTSAYPAAAPALATTIPAHAKGLMVLRVRLKDCAGGSGKLFQVAGVISVVRSGQSPRDARLDSQDDSGDPNDTARPASLALQAPSCKR